MHLGASNGYECGDGSACAFAFALLEGSLPDAFVVSAVFVAGRTWIMYQLFKSLTA